MPESKLIPTITILEGIPPDIDIITFYAELLGVPNILRAFIAPTAGEVSNGVIFAYGEGGVVMKNWPDFIDVSLEEGQLKVITPIGGDAPADALNYFIDGEGELGYFFPDIPFHPNSLTEFGWGLDFGVLADITLTGNLIDSISHMTGSSAGTWSATGTKRPQLIDGAAVFDGVDDELLASYIEFSADGEIFIVAKISQNNNYFLTQGDGSADGNNISFGTLNNHTSIRQTTAGQVNYEGAWDIDQTEFHLFHFKKSAVHRQDGFKDGNVINGEWFIDGSGTADELAIGKIRQASNVYYPISVKEILYFSNLTDEKRECIEAYLKYKHDIPVYVNPYHIT